MNLGQFPLRTGRALAQQNRTEQKFYYT